VYELANRAVVGRLDSCDLPIDDRSVSREHARFSRLRDTYILEDLGSTNGTLVNGRRIDESVILRPGDVVTFGSVEFRYETVPTDAPGDGAQVEEEEPVSAEPTSAGPTAESLPPVPVSFPPMEPLMVPSAVAETEGQDASSQDRIAIGSDASTSTVDSSYATAVDTVTQLANESRATAQTLLNLLEDLGNTLQENERMRNQLERRLSGLVASKDAREAARRALHGAPQSSIAQDQVESLQQVLAELIEHPRDVEILMRVGNLASVLAAVLNEWQQLRSAIEQASSALDGAAGSMPS
jgi:pSer/pThr/pTyr-binding forkhead associated (FHA) protein